MITTISATNRPGSQTYVFADYYADLLADELGQKSQLLDLADLGDACLRSGDYTADRLDPDLRAVQERYLLSAAKLAIFVPEYNGSYPGILKLFIDAVSVNEYARIFGGKTVALVGVASGRAGNLRGMDHLAEVIGHMGGWVLPNRLPISGIEQLLDADGRLDDAETKMALRRQAEQLIAA